MDLPEIFKVLPGSILATKEWAEALAKRYNQDFSFPAYTTVDDEWAKMDFGEVPKSFARQFTHNCPFQNEVHFFETGNRMPLFAIVVYFPKPTNSTT